MYDVNIVTKHKLPVKLMFSDAENGTKKNRPNGDSLEFLSPE